jgi:hypothetical protein
MASTIDQDARSIYDIVQRSSAYLGANGADEESLISALTYYLNRSINQSNLVYITAADSPYLVTQSSSVVSCNTEDGNVEVILPNVNIDGFSASIIHYEGQNNVIVTTVNGTENIGNSTTQEIRNTFRGIGVISQLSSGLPEYIITQDNRGELDGRVRITKPSDFGIIDSTKVYFIDGIVDMLNIGISVPSTGITIDGFGFGVSKLISSANNFTLFDGGVTTNGNVFISNCEIEITGTDSKVFDINNSTTGTEAVELNTVNFNNCTAIGTITGYRQGLFRSSGLFGCQDGFIFDGTWIGGVRIESFLVRQFGSSGTIFKRGASLQLQNRLVSNANLNVPTGSVGYDFIESNFATDGLFQLLNGNFTGGGTYVAGITEASTKVRFRINVGILNTYVGGAWSISTSTDTTIDTSGVAVKMAGTTIATNLNWFSQSANNELRSDSTSPIVIDIKMSLSFISGNNNQLTIKLRFWDNSASSYSEISSVQITANGNGRAENVVLLGLSTMNEDDRIEVWVQNDSSTTAVTVQLGGQLIVSERQS